MGDLSEIMVKALTTALQELLPEAFEEIDLEGCLVEAIQNVLETDEDTESLKKAIRRLLNGDI